MEMNTRVSCWWCRSEVDQPTVKQSHSVNMQKIFGNHGNTFESACELKGVKTVNRSMSSCCPVLTRLSSFPTYEIRFKLLKMLITTYSFSTRQVKEMPVT